MSTLVQIKRSTANSAPGSLLEGELAYSYVSNTLFIGDTASGVMNVGGKLYTDLIDGASAANGASTFVRRYANGSAQFQQLDINLSPTSNSHVATKEYVDQQVSGTVSLNSLTDVIVVGANADQNNRLLIGTSLGVAQSINSFTKEGQKHQHQPIIRPMSPPPSDLDLRVNSFDYNNLGKTPEEILGKRFSRLKFPSEAVRQSTLRSIFQKIVDDPVTPHYARVIALGQLGQIDGPKNTKEEIEQILSRTISRLDTHKDPDIIPPPQLGENSLDGRTLKTLQTRLGIEDRVSFDEISTSLFKSILHNLSSVITSARLRESEAYALMKRITKGVSYETVQIHELEHRTPFIDYWITIQKTQRRSCSPREYEKKLKAVLSSDKIDNLEKALNEIMIYTFKIHEKEPDPAYRRMLTQRECLKNFRTFIRTHFAPYFSQINTCYMDRLRQMALENNDPSFSNATNPKPTEGPYTWF